MEVWARAETWVEVRASDETQRLRNGQEAEIGGYGIFVERTAETFVAESVALYRLRHSVREAAVEATRLLTRTHGGLSLVSW
jgi:hypothetical protein